VPLDPAAQPAEKGDAVFSPADYFLGIAQRLIAKGENARIVSPWKGEVSIYPGQHEFSAEIPDWAEFFSAPATQFEITPLGASAAPQAPAYGRNISELLWQAAFHASQGRLVEGTSKYDVVQFRNWPNLSRLSKTGNTARICALLTRHATTIMLVHRQLDVDREEVYRVYSAAHAAGIATLVSRNPQGAAFDGGAPDEAAATAEGRSLLRSLFSKISGL